MSVADGSPSTSSKISSYVQRPTKSISSRVSSFLTPKSSHTNSFFIELDHPVKTYGAGDAVKGKVVLDIARPLGVTHIVVGLHGYVQVFKNHAKSKSNHPNSVGRAVTGRGKRWVSEYYGDGYMSLFDEEIVLCGEGRLDPTYSPFHFHFNLEFPSELALPSSIDFERGTISYVVKAKMTRPAYTAPTMSCNSKVVFLEDIDVAMIPGVKPQEATIHLEHRSGSPRSSLRRFASYDVKRSRQTSTSSTTIQQNRSTFESTPSNPGAASERVAGGSFASTRSSSSDRKRLSVAPSEPRSSHTSPSLNGEIRAAARQVTASAQLCSSGCLPGQVVSLLVKINHNKIVHNPSGILVTLYRQARVDMHPHLPLASSEKGSSARYEDYYPRSRTGLGGLSLSAAGSSQVWRKDLSQTTAPLYINPSTMSHEIKVGIRVPELPGAFPSIRNVPGQMISFRYVVEVIIDIYGKLIGRDWALSDAGRTPDMQQSHYFNGSSMEGDNGDRTQSTQATTFESRCIDTTQLRRDKHAMTVECELIVGTRDSRKSKGKQKELAQNMEPVSDSREAVGGTTTLAQSRDDMQQDPPIQPTEQSHSDEGYNWAMRWDNRGLRWLYIDEWGYVYDNDWNYVGYEYGSELDLEHASYYENPATLIQPPQFAESGEVTEKERLRRAEESLLPSRPPLDIQSSISAAEDRPTAPDLAAESYHSPPAPRPRVEPSEESSRTQNSASSQTTRPEAPAAPSYDSQGSSLGASGTPLSARTRTDDKADLERQRLRAEASEPAEISLQNASYTEPSAPQIALEEGIVPTAPILLEEDGAQVTRQGMAAVDSEDLPQYQR